MTASDCPTTVHTAFGMLRVVHPDAAFAAERAWRTALSQEERARNKVNEQTQLEQRKRDYAPVQAANARVQAAKAAIDANITRSKLPITERIAERRAAYNELEAAKRDASLALAEYRALRAQEP